MSEQNKPTLLEPSVDWRQTALLTATSDAALDVAGYQRVYDTKYGAWFIYVSARLINELYDAFHKLNNLLVSEYPARAALPGLTTFMQEYGPIIEDYYSRMGQAGQPNVIWDEPSFHQMMDIRARWRFDIAPLIEHYKEVFDSDRVPTGVHLLITLTDMINNSEFRCMYMTAPTSSPTIQDAVAYALPTVCLLDSTTGEVRLDIVESLCAQMHNGDRTKLCDADAGDVDALCHRIVTEPFALQWACLTNSAVKVRTNDMIKHLNDLIFERSGEKVMRLPSLHDQVPDVEFELLSSGYRKRTIAKTARWNTTLNGPAPPPLHSDSDTAAMREAMQIDNGCTSEGTRVILNSPLQLHSVPELMQQGVHYLVAGVTLIQHHGPGHANVVLFDLRRQII